MPASVEVQRVSDTPAPEPVAIEAVLAKGIQVQWPEGVAVIDGVCSAATATNAGAAHVPDPSGIFITADGSVLLRGGRAGGDVSRRLARTLHDLLAAEQLPPQLRLFISTWIGATESRSIQQFARELAYFARPDGPALIRALYDRYLHDISKASTPAPGVTSSQSPAPQRARSRHRRRRLIVVAALIVLGTVAAAAGLWVGNDPTRARAQLSDVTGLLTETARDLRAAAGSFGNRLGLPLPGADPNSAPAPNASDTPANDPRPPPVATAAGGPVVAVTEPLSSSAAAAPASPSSRPQAAAPDRADAGFIPAEATTPEQGPDADAPIYSSADSDVIPPTMIYPQLPLQADASAAANVVELVVSASGEVEEVRMLAPVRRLPDVMLLSNAKAWRFEPALRAGVSVRYRLTVRWAVAP